MSQSYSLEKYIFSDHTCLHGNHKNVIIMIYDENRVFAIFHSLYGILSTYLANCTKLSYIGNILCNSIADNLSRLDFFAHVDIHNGGNYSHENAQNQQQIYIQSTYLLNIFVFGVFVPDN